MQIFNLAEMKKKKKAAKQADKQGGKLAGKAAQAMKNEFYLEASWIISSMLEKKLKKLLGQIESQPPGSAFTLEQSIKRVKYLLVSSKQADLTAHPTAHPTAHLNVRLDVRLDVRLIDDIRNWKNQRNEILKDIPDIHVSQARLERLALEGIRLLKEWKKAVKEFKSSVS